MTTKQYLAALKILGLSVASKRTASALGVSVRQCQRFATGTSPITPTIGRLIAMYLHHGLPNSTRNEADICDAKPKAAIPEGQISIETAQVNPPKPLCFHILVDHHPAAILTYETVKRAIERYDALNAARR